jgi:hypothetical protein
MGATGDEVSASSLCVDMGSSTRGCQGVSSKQWELGFSGFVWGVFVS